MFKRVGKLAEDENDRIAFKAFQVMLKIVNEGRCPRLNAIDDLLVNSPYAMVERAHNDHVENDPDYPSILHDIGTRFVRAMAPRMHVLIARQISAFAIAICSNRNHRVDIEVSVGYGKTHTSG